MTSPTPQVHGSLPLAVLPFVNMSTSEENEYFSDGLTEEIINALAKLQGLQITSRTSSFFFKNKNLPIQQIAQELGVSTILEGSVRLANHQVRITAQLIDAEEDVHFWSETFDRSLEHIFEVQEEVSQLIADKLREHHHHFEISEQLVEELPIPVPIYQKYLKGRFHMMKLGLPESMKAVEIYREVLEEYPDFVLAHLGINQVYAYAGTMGLIRPSEAFPQAQPHLEKAIALGEHLPETQLNLAWIKSWQLWDLESAITHVQRSLDIRPSDEAYLTMANFLTIIGKFKPAHHYIDQALAHDPFSGMLHHYRGYLYYLEERYEEAILCFQKSLQLKPDLPFPPLYWGESLIQLGKGEEALAYYQALPNRPHDLTKQGGALLANVVLGNTSAVEQGMKEMEGFRESDLWGSAINFLILAYALLEKEEESQQWIKESFETHQPMSLLLFTEPILKPLIGKPLLQEWRMKLLGSFDTLVPSSRKYKKSLLDEGLIEDYSQTLQGFMLEEQPFLDPDLTLRNLADQIGLTHNRLSQLLNEGFNKNFSDFVNGYRLEVFKENIGKPSLQHLTLLAIAFESGFNSKTVFNTYFKKKMGMTPKAYWKEKQEA